MYCHVVSLELDLNWSQGRFLLFKKHGSQKETMGLITKLMMSRYILQMGPGT